MNTLKIIALTSAALAAFANVPFAQASAGGASDQHAEMAQQLQQKATTASQRAAAHEAMARAGGSPKAAAGAMSRHCDKLIAQYRAEAARYSAQAAQHQQHAGAVTLTRAQHLALADELNAKAAVANERAAAHEVMARSASPKASQQAMSNHCDRLIAQYRSEADDYAAKAAAHRLAAK